MTKFPFSITGRRKMPSVYLEEDRPLSKAHKILGSTPINIDNPIYPERASSSAIDVTLSAGAKQLAHDALSEDNVRLAMSEGEWEGDPGFTPAHQSSSIVRDVYSEARLRKAQSSTAIRSQTRLHPISKHSSTLVLPTSHPFRNSSHVEDANVANDTRKTKKKPAVLDFSNLMPCSQASRHSYQSGPDSAASGSFTSSSRTASVLPSPSQHTTRLGHKSSSLKRRTKESLRSLLSDASGSTSSGGNQREVNSDSGLSTLYNHYEQMSLLQVIKQDQASDDGAQLQADHLEPYDQLEWQEAQVEEQDLDWLHKPFRDTVQTFPPASHKSSSRRHGGKRASSKNRRVPKHPKKPEKSKEDADFHDKSVLLLSDSDSDTPANIILQNRTYEPAPRSNKVHPRSSPSKERVRGSSQTRPSSEHYARKPVSRRTTDSHRTTFRPEDDYSPVHSRLSHNPRSPSPTRESLSSRDSKASVVTCQFGFGSQQEPAAVTSLPARRPSQAELEAEAARVRASDNVIHAVPREPVPGSPEQLTPPLSPTSVDFYIRSARPSVDMADPPNRIMAVTREEKMLIAALRKKNQELRENAKLETQARLLNGGRWLQGYDPASFRLAPTQSSPTYDLGFPKPPIIQMKPNHHTESTAARNGRHPSIRSLDDALSQGDYAGYRKGDYSRKESDAVYLRERQGSSAVYQDVLVYLDQSRAPLGGPDNMENDDGLDGPSGLEPDFNPVSWDHDEDVTLPIQSDFILPRKRYHPGRIQTENIPPASRRLATLSEHDLGEAPRPESPISPESFPSLPTNRVRSQNMARLSAVGWESPGASVHGKPIWGDDD